MTYPPAETNSDMPAGETGRMPATARVWLGPSTLRMEDVGRAPPAGNSVTKPAAVESAIVTLTAIATASAGPPAGRANENAVPPVNFWPADRESYIRCGVIGTNRPAL